MDKQHAINMESLTACMQDPQVILSKALEERNLRDFKIAIDMEGDPTRMDPKSNISMFEKALQTHGCSDFVEECIRRGCKCDYTNRRTNKAPISYAADSRDPKIISSVLSLKNVPVDTKYANLTPLNSLAKNLLPENYTEIFSCLKSLLSYGANPNIPDQKEMTPILYVVNNKKLDNDKKREILKYFLEHSDVDLDTFRDGEARERITSKFPDIQLPEENSANISFETLVTLLRNGNEEKFIKNFNEYQLNISEKDNQQNVGQEQNLNLLMESIKKGLNEAVDVILKAGLNVNLIHNGNSPIKIASIYGNSKALQKLLDEDDLKIRKDENLLITVIKKLDEQNYNDFSDYNTCFYTLLDSDKIDINEVDPSGSSALHYAVKYKNEKAIKELLKRGAYIGTKSAFNDFPITEINPEILEDYFDSCITTNGYKPGDESFEVIINYTNLMPIDSKNKRNLTNVRSEMMPIEHIAENKELRHLLKHPLITSFLFLKWHRLSIVFYINFLLYAIFCASLVIYIILKFNNTADDVVIELFHILSFLGLVYMIAREILQFFMSPHSFIRSCVNYLELALIILTIVTLSEPNYESETQRVLAVFTILLASVELCLLVGSLPVLSISTHMLMLRAVSTTFMKSFTLYSIFLITFSLCFYILFGKPGKLNDDGNADANAADNDDGEFNNFANPFTAIIKTIVMLTGEFDAGDIAFHSFYSYLVFLLFVFFMSIVLFNLLNGLAVSDTQAIKSQAELNGSICRSIILSGYERALAGKDGKTSFIVNHEPFKSISKRLTNIFPDFISGNHIAILPNERNKIMIPISTSTEMGPMSKVNGTALLKKSVYDIDREKKILDPPIKLLPCCCSFLTGKCSEMDVRTVKTALAIIEKKYQNSKEKLKLMETENRLKKIEDKIEKILDLLNEIAIK